MDLYSTYSAHHHQAVICKCSVAKDAVPVLPILPVPVHRCYRQVGTPEMENMGLLRQASKFLNKEALGILGVQLYLQKLNRHGRRWSDSFKPFALNLYFHSPTARYLARLLSLPSVKSFENSMTDIVIGQA